jgi:hypothetical protein
MNNFDLIREKLEFNDKNDFYIIEIIKRRKDDNELSKSQKMINYFEVSNLEAFDNLKPTLIEICDNENARAYIRMNIRNRKKIALEVLRELSDRIADGDYNIKNIYHSILGQFHSDKNKKWLIDVDKEDNQSEKKFLDWVDIIKNFLVKQYASMKREDYVLYTVDTINGKHIICSPFNTHLFLSYFQIEIHKDNPTLLYFSGKE